MKKFTEIWTDHQTARAKQEELEKDIKRLYNTGRDLARKYSEAKCTATDEEMNSALAEYKAIDDQIHALQVSRVRQKILVAYLDNNTRYALAAEVVPVICEILARYNGKSYGPKTREKINAEVKEKTGCTCWLGEKEIKLHNSEIWRDLEFYTLYDKAADQFPRFLVDNKVQALTPDQFAAYGLRRYYDDPAAAVQTALDLWEAARKAQKAARDAASAYNAVLVDHLQDADAYHPMYDYPVN